MYIRPGLIACSSLSSTVRKAVRKIRHAYLNQGSLSHGKRSPCWSLMSAVLALEFSTWQAQQSR